MYNNKYELKLGKIITNVKIITSEVWVCVRCWVRCSWLDVVARQAAGERRALAGETLQQRRRRGRGCRGGEARPRGGVSRARLRPLALLRPRPVLRPRPASSHEAAKINTVKLSSEENKEKNDVCSQESSLHPPEL